ncbi:hypothetical protein NVP1167O_32 [Vibrio phage 1.167.O._10N.261.51.F2]|nr:hypothetical protein NVP1167O_32 [Vibrio phage 1.167.O._10N.261.51.F2]
MEKFTKGVWEASCVKINEKEVRNGWGVSVDGATIASVYTGATFCVIHEQQKANANLIASAPEMYDLLNSIENDSEQVPEWLFERIQLVLAKARGESEAN